VIRPPDASYFSIIDFRDAEGRPLGEGKQANLRAGAPMVLGACRYPGSRFEHALPMNQSALQQLRRHWQACRGLLDWARRAHVGQVGANRATFSDVWRSARVAQTLPGWLLLRDREPVPDGTLPPPIAATFKIVIGITFAAQDLHLRRALDDRYDAHAPAEPDQLLDHVEQHGLLIGPTQVCAGPTGMIREVVALLIGGDAQARLEPAVASLLGDGVGPLGYAGQAMQFYAAGSVMQLFVHALTVAAAQLAESVRTPSDAVGQANRSLFDAVPRPPQLRRAAALPPRRLAAIAESITGFMTGHPPADGPTARALAALIATWQRARRRAEIKLAEFIAAAAAPVLTPAPVVPLLATQLALEQAWLRLNHVGEAGLTRALGREPPARTMPELDRLLGPTVLRKWFEAALGVEIAQHEGGARLRCGGAALELPVALL
jgi:hypothetical protein